MLKKDLNKCYIRLSLWGETSLNFERMQGIGFCNAMIPALKEIVYNKEDLSEALKRHLQFFNTETYVWKFDLWTNNCVGRRKKKIQIKFQMN